MLVNRIVGMSHTERSPQVTFQAWLLSNSPVSGSMRRKDTQALLGHLGPRQNVRLLIDTCEELLLPG